MLTMLRQWPLALALLLGLFFACSVSDDEAGDEMADDGEIDEEACGQMGEEFVWFEERCVEYAYRYEPDEQLDPDNVVNPSGTELLSLADIRPAPKSGVRIVLTAVEMGPFEEFEYCHSWKVPAELQNKFVYTSEVHSTPGLHHANVFGITEDPAQGPQPTPQCHPGAASFIGGGIGDVIGGKPLAEVPVPEVLFANSTQVVGGERNMLRDGAAFKLTSDWIVADTHLFNPTPDPIRVEVVYDFYTMPEEKVETELKAFMYLFTDFKIPAQSKYDLVAECPWWGGDVYALMPHMHEWGVGYDVKFFDDFEGTMTSNPYSEAGFNLPESDIRVFEDPVKTDGSKMVRFTCQYDNTTDHPMCHGTGENEMCFMFGYVTAANQSFGIIPTEGAPCIGTLRTSTDSFDLTEYLGGLEADVRTRLLEVFSSPGGASTCPEESPAIEPTSPWD